MGIDATCDGCGKDLSAYDEVLCGECYHKQIDDRDEHIAALKQEIEELKGAPDA